MIIINAGVPRSGTVLVNAMIRTLLVQAGVGIAQTNPHGRQLTALVQRLKRDGQYRHKPILVHTHSWDAETQRMLVTDPHVVAFASYRDPRDVCVSMMKLHDMPFDDVRQSVSAYFQVFETVVQALDAIVLPYELLVASKEAHCFQIARHLGLWPTFEQVRAVVEETSVERHRTIMEDVRAGRIAELTERQNSNRILREDRHTLINDRHIQSGVAGRWRTELSEQQQETANAAFDTILERYGYER